MKLAIFKVNQLGDNVVFLPVVQALRRQYPQWDQFVITSPVASELFAADVTPRRMLVISTRDFNGAWRHPRALLDLVARIRGERFDASLLSPDQGNVAHLLALLAGGKLRVGVRPPFIKVPGGLTEIVPLPSQLPIAQANWEIARTLVQRCGGTEWADSPPAPDLSHLTAGARPIPRRIVIHAGASRAYQRWPAARFHSLAERLAREFDVMWIDQPETTLPEFSSRVQRIRPDTLGEFVRTLGEASLFVGNNSGPMHLAAAIGCPSVIICGPSNPVWDPVWHADRIEILRDTTLACLPCDKGIRPAGFCTNTASPLACMTYWSVDEVEARCRARLERGLGGEHG